MFKPIRRIPVTCDSIRYTNALVKRVLSSDKRYHLENVAMVILKLNLQVDVIQC